MIKVKNVVKTFGGFKALDNATLNVKKGSVYGLIGPNGAGKTTVIKNLTGIYTPDSGSLEIDGLPVFENPDIKQELIYIGDDLYFFPTYSIMDMAKFYAGIYKNWNWERFNNLKEVFKIDVKRKVRRLSKGMQKQVAVLVDRRNAHAAGMPHHLAHGVRAVAQLHLVMAEDRKSVV